MDPNDEYPLWLQVVALAVILAPTLALLAFRRRLGLMNTAAALVIWGAFAACTEHGHWAMRLAIHERSWSNPHSTVHYFMRRSGWFAVLFALLVGGSLELAMNGPTGHLYHHIGLYGYMLAWLAALVIAYRPTFVGRDQFSSEMQGGPVTSSAEPLRATLTGDEVAAHG